MPRPTYRRRNNTRCESARPCDGCPRSTNTPLNGSGVVAASGSGVAPFSVQPQLRDEARVAEEQALRAVGIDLAGAARDAERRTLDERHDAVGTDARARARRPRLRHREQTTTRRPMRLIGVLRRPVRRSRISLRGRCGSQSSPRCGSPCRPRATAASSSSCRCSPTARRRRTRRHAVRERRVAHQGRSSSSPMPEPPDPRELGNPWYDGYHALVVVPPDRRLRRRARPRRHRRADLRRDAARPPAGRAHAARSLDRADTVSSTACSHVTCTSSRSATRSARDNPDVPYVGHGPQRHRPRTRTRTATTRTTSSSTSAARIPTRDRRRRSRSRGRAGLPLHMILKRGEPPEREYFEHEIEPLLAIRHRAVRERDARGEGRPARPGAARWCSRSAGPSRSGS